MHQARAKCARLGRNQRGSIAERAEMRLTVLTYNMKRMIMILCVPAIIAAVLTRGNDASGAKSVIAGNGASMIVVIWRWFHSPSREFFTRSGAVWGCPHFRRQE